MFIKKILMALALNFERSNTKNTEGLSIMIFSKDRPMQLEALLNSIKVCVEGEYQLIVQWSTSSTIYDEAYHKVLDVYKDIIFKSCREENFRNDLLRSLNQFKFSKLMFLVDDIIFTNNFKTAWLKGIDLKKVVPSIRLWSGINYTQPSDSINPAPEINSFYVKPWLSFSWVKSGGYWSMPLAVDGNIFDIKEILFLLKHSSFKAPNTLEKALGPYRFLFKYRKGICLDKPLILNFALNRVNIENSDFECGDEYSSEKLLELWNNGKKIDLKAMQAIESNSCHIICTPKFMDTNN